MIISLAEMFLVSLVAIGAESQIKFKTFRSNLGWETQYLACTAPTQGAIDDDEINILDFDLIAFQAPLKKTCKVRVLEKEFEFFASVGGFLSTSQEIIRKEAELQKNERYIFRRPEENYVYHFTDNFEKPKLQISIKAGRQDDIISIKKICNDISSDVWTAIPTGLGEKIAAEMKKNGGVLPEPLNTLLNSFHCVEKRPNATKEKPPEKKKKLK